jgi:anti-sigma factor RsiW
VTCQELADFIADYLDGELPPAEVQAFDRHLARCGNCARYLEAYRQSVAMGRQAFVEPGASLPSDVPEQLVDAILRARHAGRDPDS